MIERLRLRAMGAKANRQEITMALHAEAADAIEELCAALSEDRQLRWRLRARLDAALSKEAGQMDSAATTESRPTWTYYFGEGTRRHEASSVSRDGWVTMWCGISGPNSGRAKKVMSSRGPANCRACARAKKAWDQ